MPLADGDPAPEGDVWYRSLTSDKHITKGIRMRHLKAIFSRSLLPTRTVTGTQKRRPPPITRGSLDDVARTARTTVGRSTARSTAFMFPKEPLAGQTIENLQVGIYYTPIDGRDLAHSDLTTHRCRPLVERSEEHDRLVMALSGKFKPPCTPIKSASSPMRM